MNLDTGDRFVRGKWKECVDDVESNTYSVGLLVSGDDLLVAIDGYFAAILVNGINKSELEGSWYAFHSVWDTSTTCEPIAPSDPTEYSAYSSEPSGLEAQM